MAGWNIADLLEQLAAHDPSKPAQLEAAPAETLRRSLHRHLGVSPEAYRQRFAHRSPDHERTPA